MKKFISVLILFVFLAGCKTPQKATNNTKRSEKKDIANDITLTNDSKVYDAISRGIQTAINEKLQLSFNQKKYDTDKPIDPETGKPPLKEENNVNLAEETNTQINDSTQNEHSAENNLSLTDKTKDKTKLETAEQTTTERELSRIELLAICTVSALLIVLVIYIIRKFKK